MYDDSEEFMIELTALVAKYGNYEAPRLKADGDLLIPLRSDLKRGAAAAESLAKALVDMMKDDKKLKQKPGWVD